MLCVHGQEVAVTKQLCDVSKKDSNGGFLGAMLKVLFSFFLAEIVLILYSYEVGI